jgi:uncharacterized protein (DUF885 family)
MKELADDLINAYFDAHPLIATLNGIRDREEGLTDYSEAGQEAFAATVEAIAERAETVDPATLGADDRITRAVVLEEAEHARIAVDARAVEYAITDTWTADALSLLMNIPLIGLTEQAQADGYVARLGAIPRALDQIAERHRTGIAAGRVPVARLVKATIAFLDRYLANRDRDPLCRPVPPGDATAFVTARDRLIDDEVRPAVARYREVLATEVLPHGRPTDRPGLTYLPDGDATYANLVRVHTTTDRTPEQLHQTGLDQVERLADEYRTIGSRVFGTSDLQEIFQRLRSDPALRWASGEELLESARTAISRAETVAPQWFGKLPSQSCVVEPVPADEAPGAVAAYYWTPALDGSRPGTYFANTYKADERYRYVSESTAFHEGVPGHHFQLTIAMELTDLPLLRRLAFFNAYIEGWGLYSERLADEMGLYSNDVTRLGMLAGDSMRACRLVVDTGLHAKGWSHQQVVDFIAANSVMPMVEIVQETDRYISDPGQALGYMVGRLEIQRIRAAAEASMGDRFDVREFHDIVLGNGPVPLTVLDEMVGDWAR